jgi:cobalt-zinc-cadmium efflux system protein
LALAGGLNAAIFLLELAGGFLTNSLGLVSDAMHNLSDLLGLGVSYTASKVAVRQSNSQKSYGYLRAEIIAAFINALTLVLVGIYIIYEGIVRFRNPQPVTGLWMTVIGVVALAANTAATLLLRRDARHDLSVRSAFLHLLGDAIQSLAVIVAGALIYWKNLYFLDSVVSIAIGVFLIVSARGIIQEAVNILAEGAPESLDVNAVASFLRQFPEVEDIHHLHIWSLSSRFHALSAHIVVRDQMLSDGGRLAKALGKALKDRFQIDHPTLQLETEPCDGQTVIVSPNDFQG